jgi:hypothetical protein
VEYERAPLLSCVFSVEASELSVGIFVSGQSLKRDGEFAQAMIDEHLILGALAPKRALSSNLKEGGGDVGSAPGNESRAGVGTRGARAIGAALLVALEEDRSGGFGRESLNKIRQEIGIDSNVAVHIDNVVGLAGAEFGEQFEFFEIELLKSTTTEWSYLGLTIRQR